MPAPLSLESSFFTEFIKTIVIVDEVFLQVGKSAADQICFLRIGKEEKRDKRYRLSRSFVTRKKETDRPDYQWKSSLNWLSAFI